MPTKTARRDYNELLPGFVTSQTLINPAPRNMQQRGRGEFSQSQHTGSANQSEPIVYFWGRGFIKPGNDQRVYRRRDRAV